MSIHPINEAEKNLRQLINVVIESHQPVVITNDGSNAMLLSEGNWASIQETLYFSAIPGMRESIQEGLATSIEDCAKALDW
ncbi:antitoxin of toxin-antitoxin stability system [Leptolyngbya sp. PCC 7375]|nr:antitoxin of toxin-antitoxin stability system [Leptolyngbya sp. PCC 7375]